MMRAVHTRLCGLTECECKQVQEAEFNTVRHGRAAIRRSRPREFIAQRLHDRRPLQRRDQNLAEEEAVERCARPVKLLSIGAICKICYSISRNIQIRCCNGQQPLAARFLHQARAFGAPLSGFRAGPLSTIERIAGLFPKVCMRH